jgi:hypothetical protein
MRKSAFSARSRAVSTHWVRSRAANARPAAKACSGPKTISKVITVATRCTSSTRCSCGKIGGCSLQTFEETTGLKLTDDNGIKDDLPPIKQCAD